MSQKGRFDTFAKGSANGRYLRIPDGSNRREADVADAALNVSIGRKTDPILSDLLFIKETVGVQ
jgi:hypothetical protein